MLQITSITNNPLGILLVEEVNKILSRIGDGSSLGYIKTVDLPIDEESSTILGSSFTPPITKQPTNMTAIQIDELGVGTIIYPFEGFAPNADGVHWDVLIMPITETTNNVKIAVQ